MLKIAFDVINYMEDNKNGVVFGIKLPNHNTILGKE